VIICRAARSGKSVFKTFAAVRLDFILEEIGFKRMTKESTGVVTALTIGGSDPSAGAGVQVDALTLAQLKVFPFSVITAVTAQNSLGVTVTFPLPPRLVLDQLEAIFRDFGVSVVKTGMLGSKANAMAVSRFLKEQKMPLVVDPVLKASDGTPLFEDSDLSVFKEELFPLAILVTPNIEEVRRLTGISVRDTSDIDDAAKTMYGLGAKWVLIKGGHLKGEDSSDFLYDGKELRRFPGEKIGTEMRGTGCIFASAIAAHLAQGKNVPEATKLAKELVTGKIKSAFSLGEGRPQALPWT